MTAITHAITKFLTCLEAFTPIDFVNCWIALFQVLSLQHSGSKDSSHSQFASYWKPILSMDGNFWQRWLHMHRIAIILEHDVLVTVFSCVGSHCLRL